MHELALSAAKEWANAHAARERDPVKFGSDVALVHAACLATQRHEGDARATSAALAALSIPPEVLQGLLLIAAHFPPMKAGMNPQGSCPAGTE